MAVQKSIHSEAQLRLQRLLRQIRVEAGLTQVELAARLEIPQNYISNYERGERRLDILELRQVCNAVGVSTRDFLGKLEEMLPDESQ